MQFISTIRSSLPGHENLEMKELMKNANTYRGEGTQEEKLHSSAHCSAWQPQFLCVHNLPMES